MAKRTFLTHESDPAHSPAEAGEAGSRTLIERAYAQLRDDIIEGRLAPDEKLRVEHLKAHYQVGAGTLREA
ncbi:MAG: transcriptional regulator, partial [Burkholderiales bacterium PBB5]